MDVTMPDGTVIQGVPDGTTKAQLAAKYAAHLSAKPSPNFDTPDAATAQEISQASPQSMPAPLHSSGPTIPTSFQGSTAGSVLQGALIDPFKGLSQIVPRGLSEVSSVGGLYPNAVSKAFDAGSAAADRMSQRNEAMYGAARAAAGHTGFDLPRLAGNIVSPVNYAAGEILGPAEGAGIVGRVMAGARTGATIGAMQPTNPASTSSFAEQKALQMGLGATGGAVMPVVGAGLSKIVAPAESDVGAHGRSPDSWAIAWRLCEKCRRQDDLLAHRWRCHKGRAGPCHHCVE